MILTVALAAARLVHESSLLVLFGLVCFPLYARPEGWDPAFHTWRRRRQVWAVCLAVVSGLLWLAFTAANMSGDIHDAVDPATILATTTDTDFGRLWAVRLSGCVVLAAAVATGRMPLGVVALATLVLGSLAGTGHAQLPGGLAGTAHQLADVAHLLAAGVWIGALWALGGMVAKAADSPSTRQALTRFSVVGQAAVAVLGATGLANAAAILDSPAQLFTTLYGRLLLLKLAAFAGMLGLAALNRFVLVPRLEAEATQRRLRLHIFGEQALALIVVLVVSVIGTIDPAG